ncbi:FG-GAP-like repeat-containing protein, partial [Patescibacteria group bacterium]
TDIGVGGSGTENYLSKWSSDNKTLLDAQVFDNSTFVGLGGTAVNTNPFVYIGANTGNVGIGTTNPGAKLDITEVNTNGAKAINLTTSADTDGDYVYGMYNTVDTGSGTLSGDHRYAYGAYNDITSAADYDGVAYKYPYAMGMYNNMTSSGEGSRTYGVYNWFNQTADTTDQKSFYGFKNDFDTWSGDNTDIFGIYSSLAVGGTGSSLGIAAFSRISLEYDDGEAQTGYGNYNVIGYLGSSDIWYANYVAEVHNDFVAGGTGYGIYIDLDSGNWDNLFGVYETGGATNYFAGNVGIGTTNPGYKLEVTGDGYVSTNLSIGGTANIGNIATVADNNRVLTSSGAGSGNVQYIDTSSWDKSSADDVWMLSGDSGTPQSIGAGDTAFFQGGIGIGTTVGGSDDLTIYVDELYDFNWLGTHSYSAADFNFISDTGFTLDVTNDLYLDADGGEILFADGGAWYGGWISGGNFGIGTTNPLQKLQLEGNIKIGTTDGTRYIFFEDGAGTGLTYPGFRFNTADDSMEYSNDGSSWSDIGSGGGGEWTDAGSGLWLYPTEADDYLVIGGTGPTDAEIKLDFNGVSWFTGGNVGIGTTNPGYALEVTGDLSVGTTANIDTLNLTGMLLDAGGEPGTSDQILTSTGTGTSWQDITDIGVGGSGTENYLSKWSSDNKTLLDAQVFDNSTFVGLGGTAVNTNPFVYIGANTGNVGIGTSNPIADLQVAGGIVSQYLTLPGLSSALGKLGHENIFTIKGGLGLDTYDSGRSYYANPIIDRYANLDVNHIQGQGMYLRTSGTYSGNQNVSIGQSYPRSVAFGDVDGDGDLDFATANMTTDNVSIRTNDGTGTFSGTQNIIAGSEPLSVAFGDVDGDGDLDFAAANNGSNTVSIRTNDGTGTFSGSQNVSVQAEPYSVAFGDVDGDGDLDFAVA